MAFKGSTKKLGFYVVSKKNMLLMNDNLAKINWT
jgi:hypothetical protein